MAKTQQRGPGHLRRLLRLWDHLRWYLAL